MAYPSGFACSQQWNTSATQIVGPGVTSAVGLPPGVVYPSVSLGAGYASGVPTTPGIYHTVINGLDGTIVVSQGSVIWGWNPTNVSANVGVPFSQTIAWAPGQGLGGPPTGTVTFVMISALYPYCPPLPPTNGPYTTGLPPGLSLASNGSITGTPTAAGAYLATIVAYDGNFVLASGQNLTFSVGPGSGGGGAGGIVQIPTPNLPVIPLPDPRKCDPRSLIL